MATGGMQARDPDSQCRTCQKIMTDLKSLDCQQHFCPDCINDLEKSSEPNIKIECPVCKKSTEIPVKAKEVLNVPETLSTPVVPQPASVIGKTSVIQSPRITQLDLRNIETFFNKEAIFVDKRNCIARFVNYRNNMWAACPKENCLNVYSHDPSAVKSVPCPGIEEPCTLHPLTSQLMLVGGKNGLFVVDTDSGQVKDAILQGDVQDVHVNQGLIAVAEEVDDIGYVQVLQQSPPYNTVYRVEHPGALTVLITQEGNVLVSDWVKQNITEYNKNGDEISQYGTGGSSEPGELDFPLLCLTDTRGNILVADCDNHRLQVLTKDGNWIAPQQREMFGSPTDIMVTDTYLYVTDCNKIHMFTLLSGSKST